MRNGWLRGLSLAAVLLAVASPAGGNPLRAPKRLVDGQTVNLTPLFDWWTNHAGTRPLSAWVRVTGRVVGTNSWGWIVNAQVASGGKPATLGNSHRLVLRHPPLQDRAQFESLSAQLKDLQQQHNAITHEQSAAHQGAKTVSVEQSEYRKYGLRNRNLSREGKVLKGSEQQAKTELKPIDQHIAELKKKLSAYPSPDHYEVDCFALETGQQSERLPLYDHGSAL